MTLMKIVWLGAVIISLAACDANGGTTVSPPSPPKALPPTEEQFGYSLPELVERLANAGDVSAQAIINSGVADSLTTSNYPLVLFFTNEGNITFGSSSPEGTTESVFKRGDKNLLAYLSEQELSTEAFLNHPRLRQFVESHLILEGVPLGEIRTTKNARAKFQSASGSEIILTTKENLIHADGPVVYANDVPVDSYCYFEGSEEDMGYLCVADAPIVSDFRWSE